MKKKQFKRLEKLLVHLADSSIGNGTALHRIKADQRAIADTHSEGGQQILAHLGQIVSLLEADEPLEALAQIVENTGELNHHLTNIYRGIEQGHEGTRQTTKAIEALSKNLDFWLSKNKDEIGKIAENTHVAGQWSRAQVRSGPGLEEFTAGGTDIPEPSAPEGPDPTTADSWGGKLGEDLPADYRLSDAVRDSEADLLAIQKEAVGRFEDSVARGSKAEDANPPRVTIPLSDYERYRGQLLDEISAHNGTKERLTKAAKDHKEALRERDDLRKKQASTLADLGTAIQERQAIKEELEETEDRLKLALEDLGGHKEGLPQDASMDRFIKWVGDHGWTWIMGHRASINERLDRMEREAAYNRGNATVQDVTTTEDRGVTTSTLGKPRVIKDNPQA